MLFHASISAYDPARVAAVLAEMMRGESFRFPPVLGSYIAIAGDRHGTAIEVYPAGKALVPGDAEAETTTLCDGDRPSETHLALGVPIDEAELRRIAEREWWLCRTCDRGGAFRVVEVWVENRTLIEALTPDMQAEYLAFANPRGWEAKLRALRDGIHPHRQVESALAAGRAP
jgi:hypothetical protein